MTEDAVELNLQIQERDLLRAARPNVLVVGSEADVVDTLNGLGRNCRQPVVTCEASSSLVLPPPAQTGALILRDVGSLTREGQRRLMEWLDDGACGRVQVIATNAADLWPRVRDGSFTEALYYRLNVIYLDLTGEAHD